MKLKIWWIERKENKLDSLEHATWILKLKGQWLEQYFVIIKFSITERMKEWLLII